jgi:hypothetical protein
MHDELIELLERAGVEEQRDALASGQLAFVVLALNALLAAAKLAVVPAPFELVRFIVQKLVSLSSTT